MKVKIFYAKRRQELEDQINKWLETHPISPDSMKFQYGSEYLEDPVEHIVEHTVILFYVPMSPIGLSQL